MVNTQRWLSTEVTVHEVHSSTKDTEIKYLEMSEVPLSNRTSELRDDPDSFNKNIRVLTTEDSRNK